MWPARRRQLASNLLTLVGAMSVLGVEAANREINPKSVEDWLVVDLKGARTYKPMFIKNHSVVPHDEVSDWPVNTYYWQAPEVYYQWKVYTYGGDLKFYVNHVVTRGDTSGKYLDEPDLVLEGGPAGKQMKIGFRLAKENERDFQEGYDMNQTIKMPLSEPGWMHLVEREDDKGRRQLVLGETPVSRADFSLVLAGLNRSLIRAKYHMDQVEGSLYDVTMRLANNRSRTIECDNDCAGPLLDDLDDIGLLFDEIRRLAPRLKDGPWRRLAYLSGRADKLAEALSHYLRLIALGKGVIENYAHNLDLSTLADMLELRAGNLEVRAPGIAAEAYQTRLLAERTLEELLNGLWDKIQRTIKLLSEQGFGPGGVSANNIERIVQESEMILRELRNRNLRPQLDEAERELRRAKQLLDKIRQLLIDPEKSAEMVKRLEQLGKILLDFIRIDQEQVLRPVERANELVAEGKKKYQAILALLREADERARESGAKLDEAKRMLELTRRCLQDEALYLDQLPRQLADLNASLLEIEQRRSILTSVNPVYQRKYVDRCRSHGDELLKKSRELDGLFNATRDVADYALRAANVYKNIIEAIRGAEEAAKRAHDAAEKAYKEAVPDFEESLAERAREAKRKSMELLERAKRLRDQDVQRLSLELAKRRQLVEELVEEMRLQAEELAAISGGLRQLADKNFMEQLQEIELFLKRLLERLAEIHKRLQLLADLIYNNIKPQYERLSAGSQSSLGNLSQVIEGARKDLQAALKFALNGKLSLERLLKLEHKLDLDLDLLRRKIQLAHQEASSARPSIMASDGVCSRSYFVPAILSAPADSLQVAGFGIRQLGLVWSLHADEPESLLVLVASKGAGEQQFLALEMFERRIRLVYSLSAAAGVQTLVHPRQLDLNDRGLLNDDAWYYIQVQVSGDQVRLSVRPVPRAHERDPQQVSQRLAGASSRLQVSPYGEAELHFQVGGLPPASDFSPPSELKATRLSGCLHELQLNEQQLGLWNFKTNLGCEGCVEGPALSRRDQTTFGFSGAHSYASGSLGRQYERHRFMVSMSVRSQHQDGLLLLAISELSRHYLSVYLSKGRVGFLVGKLSQGGQHAPYLSLSSMSLFDAMNAHMNQTGSFLSSTGASQQQQQQPPLEQSLLTSRQYNNGQWFKVSAEKEGNRLTLAVEDEFRESVADDKLVALDLDQLFFGGAWPLVRPQSWSNTSLELGSFAGCLRDVQIGTAPVDLLQRQAHGVQLGCSAGAQSGQLEAAERAAGLAYPLPAGRR